MRLASVLLALLCTSCVMEVGPDEESPSADRAAHGRQSRPAPVIDFVLSPLPAQGPTTSCDDRRVLYLNFDGPRLAPGDTDDAALDVSYMVKTLHDSTPLQVPAFDPGHFDAFRESNFLWLWHKPARTRAEVAEAVRTRVSQLMQPFGVEVVTTRPAADSAGCTPPYTMIVVGGAREMIEKDPTSLVIGRAPLDCGDRHHANVGFVYSDSFYSTTRDPERALSDVVLHEAGHTYGLEHDWIGSGPTIMTTPYDASKPPQSWGAGHVTEGDVHCVAKVGDALYPWQDETVVLTENLEGELRLEGHTCDNGSQCQSSRCEGGFCRAP